MHKLEKYVGRNVRLNEQAFQRIAGRARREGVPENCFVVAAANRGTRKLICYGASFRVAVSVSEVALI